MRMNLLNSGQWNDWSINFVMLSMYVFRSQPSIKRNYSCFPARLSECAWLKCISVCHRECVCMRKRLMRKVLGWAGGLYTPRQGLRGAPQPRREAWRRGAPIAPCFVYSFIVRESKQSLIEYEDPCEWYFTCEQGNHGDEAKMLLYWFFICPLIV